MYDILVYLFENCQQADVAFDRERVEVLGRGLVELENRKLRILDRRGLEGLAEFDPAYLYLDKLPL